MAKAKQTTKKAVAPSKSTPTKAVAKKAVVKNTAKKAAPVAKKAAPVAKQATSKKAAAPAKKVPVAPKTAVKKASPASNIKKAAPVVAKKAVPAPKVVPAPKKAAPQPAEKVTKIQAKSTTSKAKVKAVEKKVAVRSKAKVVKVVKPIKEAEIVDAIAKKSDLKQAKPGAIALRDLDRGQNKKKNEEENIETFNPTRASILNETNNIGPAFRYSEEDLNEFKDIILKRLDVARENLNYYQALMARKDESGTDDTDNRFNSMEDGSGAMEREQLSQLAARQMQFIDHLEKALMRIENKTYGVCRVTGKLIDKARLKAVPHATLSMEAKSSRR